ncbi:MAG TPA: HAMP domain-containing protein, partial [Desulfuromonadales bacterium]|nr:HAMP domain-containing protein [Desulfuromonadales bacterium]
MFFRSIRFRLTLWYAITLFAVLVGSGVIWHVYLARNLLGRIDESLVIIAEDVATFYTGNQNCTEKNPCEGLEAFIRHHNWGEYVQIISKDGCVTCRSGNLGKPNLPLSQKASRLADEGKVSFETIHTLDPQPIRLLTYPVIRDHKVSEIIQVGERLASMEMALRELRIILLTFSPAALIVLSFIGWFLAGRALSPVTRITNAARKINAENLSQRLPIENTRDELSRLGETFNSMLSRLEDSFHKIRQFSADASHELRTPLTILRGETEVALRWAKTPEEFRHMLSSNLEEIDRMS